MTRSFRPPFPPASNPQGIRNSQSSFAITERKSVGDLASLSPLGHSAVPLRTTEIVEGNARLGWSGDGVAEEVAKPKEQPGKNLAVGGAGLASTFMNLGLIDEYRLFVSPVVLGGGTPYFPALEERIELELVETQTFGSRVDHVRC